MEEVRLQKLKNLRELGINPFPEKYDRTHNLREAKSVPMDTPVKVAGRIMLMRDMGKLAFAHLQDFSGQIQIALQVDILGKDQFKLFTGNFDIGDIIGVSGKIFTTHKGEISVLVEEFTILTKSLRPLPEKWHGLTNQEDRFRRRYLDMIMSKEVQDLFIKKSIFWDSVRGFMRSKGFMEVETPILENTVGGADARPFETHHNALDIDVYLRICAGELSQKKLLVGGFEKIFEIGRIFRNEGMDMEHLQDYTQMEFYWAYADYIDGMQLMEELFNEVMQKTFGTLQYKIHGFDIDLSKKWERYDYREVVLKYTGVDIRKTDLDEIRHKLTEFKVEYDKTLTYGRGVDHLWKYCRKKIAGPGFLINHPIEVSPLAKKDITNPKITHRYQIIIAGSELCNGYSELNDPIDQTSRFAEQQAMRDAGDDEAQMFDKEFVEALEYGMPPANGMGFSERVFSFFMDKPIRECVIFPLMKPEHGVKKDFKLAGAKVNESTSNNISIPITREEAWSLVQNYNQEPANLNHYLESEAVLRELAIKLGEDEELWGLVGLLHDLDWEKTVDNHREHGLITTQILEKKGFSEGVLYAIKSHNNDQLEDDFPPKSKLDYALRCGETITGLIYAYVLMRPDKKVEGVKVKSIKKKFKDKSFAAKCRRDLIKECEQLGLSLDEFIELSLTAFRRIADKIGL